MKYAVITFGCRVNQADSLTVEDELLARGARATDPESADLVVVNTCSVTASADQAARQAIRRVSRLNPDARIVVTGCYATRRPDEVHSLPNVVRVVPNDDKPRLIEFLRVDRSAQLELDLPVDRSVRLQPEPTTADRFGNGDGACGLAIEPGVAGRTAFTLRVQTGCAQACSYCIIPSARGRPRSLSIDEVLAEVERARAAGFKDIALTGVHLGSYGTDLTPASSLATLLSALVARFHPAPSSSADLLLRISSLEPLDCTRAIVDLVAASPVFAPHFHLPLQHASDRVLRAMHRGYTLEYYAALVGHIRRAIPHASIGSDVIVGFPGETDADFEALALYLEGSPLTHLHVFPYSDRPGTVAASLSGKVHGSVVRERGRVLREVSARLSRRFRVAMAGAVHQGLTIEDGSAVMTDNYLKVRIPPGRRRNERVSVLVTTEGDALRGVVVSSTA